MAMAPGPASTPPSSRREAFSRGVANAAIERPADLALARLLHTNDPRDWQKWLAAAGAPQIDATRGPLFNQASMTIDAAIDGQGVALARAALAAWDILAGRLVRPFTLALKLDYGYWIVGPREGGGHVSCRMGVMVKKLGGRSTNGGRST